MRQFFDVFLWNQQLFQYPTKRLRKCKTNRLTSVIIPKQAHQSDLPQLLCDKSLYYFTSYKVSVLYF